MNIPEITNPVKNDPFFRWLIAKGRQDEARRQILTASKINGVSVPQNVLHPEKGNFILFKIPEHQ
jgi:hypothetical protein